MKHAETSKKPRIHPEKDCRIRSISFESDCLIWVFPKIGGKPPKMDGVFHGKSYEQIHDLGVPLVLETPI